MAHKTPFLSRLQAWTQANGKPRLQAAAKGDTLSLSIYGPIGNYGYGETRGVTDREVASALKENNPSAIDLELNSPGGDAFMGVAIYNLLKSHAAYVTVRIMGEAASAAGIISQAGDRIVMGTGAVLMVHNAWTITLGSWKDHRATTNALRKLDQSQAEILSARSSLSVEKAVSLIDRETYFTADEAISWGLADEKMDGSEAEEDLELEADDTPEDDSEEAPSDEKAKKAPKTKAQASPLAREGLSALGQLFHL